MSNPLYTRIIRKRQKNRIGDRSSEDYEEFDFDGEAAPETIKRAPPLRREINPAYHAPLDPKPEPEPIDDDMFDAQEPIEDRPIHLAGDQPVSDASAAIKALLGEGGDIRAASQLEEDQLVAILDLSYVARAMNSPQLSEVAEDFLMLRISAMGGTGRQQVVQSIKGLFEPSQGVDPNAPPSGSLRGRI